MGGSEMEGSEMGGLKWEKRFRPQMERAKISLR